MSVIITLVGTDGSFCIEWRCGSGPAGIFPFRLSRQSIAVGTSIPCDVAVIDGINRRQPFFFASDVYKRQTLEYEKFYLVNAYSPNAKEKLARIDYRMEWEDALREYLLGLDEKKPVIYCGDLNVAHEEIDLKNPKTNRGNAGFSDQERAKMTQLLESGFIDVFRDKYPETTGRYTCLLYTSFLKDPTPYEPSYD